MKIRRDLGIGSELKLGISGCESSKTEGYMLLGRRKKGKRVLVSRSHGDKRIGECVCSVSI